MTTQVPGPRAADICPCGATLDADGNCNGLFAAAQADQEALTEKLAKMLYGYYGGPFEWEHAQTPECIRENYRATARDLLSALPGMVLPGMT